MMRFGLLCLWLLSSAVSAATVWLDDTWQPTTKAKAKFYGEYDATAAADDQGLHPIKIYYADNKQLRFEGKMRDPSKPGDTEQVGPYKFYYANGQLDSDGQFDEAGEFTGLTRIYNEDGTLDRTMEMKDGKINGEVRYFQSNGKLGSSYQMVNDQKQGLYQRFAEDGTTVVERGNYSNDQQEGEFRSFYDNGQLRVVRHFVAGQLDGDYLKYRQDGTPEETSHYRKGELDGANISYTNDGTKEREWNYKNGVLDGPNRYWYKNGQLMLERTYVNREQNGLDQMWSEDGRLSSVAHYKDGKLIGDKIRYHRDSEQIESIEHYNDQHQLLSRIDYDEDGNKLHETIYDVSQKQPISDYKVYKNGKLVFQRQKDPNRNWSFEQDFDENGEVTGFVTYQDNRRDGKYLSTSSGWRDNTQVRTEATFAKGKYHGDYQETELPSNIVLQQGRYQNDQKVGEWHYQEGNSTRVERYDNQGKLHGELLATTLDGKLLRREHYQHGKLHGDYEHRSEDGTVTDKGKYVNDQRDGAWIESVSYSSESWRGNYDHGKKVGDWRATSVAGYLVASAQYNKKGESDGTFYTFTEEGLLTNVDHFKNGDYHGKSVAYVGGKPYMVHTYENGKLINREEQNPYCQGDCDDETTAE
ncbi:hypothetical protein L9G74_15155 [Shewanella sp. C32]|uniref:MORN repeat variant n=1 Tax=Shewanella electrica TaxID=515560 RepID=A0ABT2FN71_9GAMM|nr:toxin-antitoxin system YwqK family antitoxin [Shewanella electrica]MCH1926246.1 hypothetical protein [Shewanella electrica]MCS4557786.1 hypothetical protein [Shewanella electrica]